MCSSVSAIPVCAFPQTSHHEPTRTKSAGIQLGALSFPALKFKSTTTRGDVNKDFYGRKPEPDGLWKNQTGAIYKIPAGDFIYHLARSDDRLQQYTPGPPLVPGVWFQNDIVVTGNHYEVTLTNTLSGASQVSGQPVGFVGIQSYPNSPMAFRDVWVK